MGKTEYAAVRMPVSLRLPPPVVERIEAYSAANHVCKTDAFLHFLEIGIAAEEEKPSISRLAAMEAKLEEVLTILKEGSRSKDNTSIGTNAVIASITSAVALAAVDHPSIIQVFLFGSMARGTANADSDIDLRLIIDRSKKFNLHDLEHFCKAVEQRTGREVNALTTKHIKNESLAASIEREKILIYERKEE